MDYSTTFFTNHPDSICVYTRVSSRKQSTDTKYGLLCQKELCNKYIKENNYTNLDVSYWEDVGSSYKTNSTLRAMSEMIRKLKPNSLILISEASRLGRSYKMVQSILKLISKKKSFIVSICENLIFGKTKIKDKQFISKVIDSEKESDVLSMRIKNTQSYIKINGGYVGKPPFGYKVTKNARNIPVLKENEKDFELIDNIVNLTSIYCSYKEIANVMNDKNLHYRNKLWTGKKIREILNKFYPEHMLLTIGTNHNSTYNSKIIIREGDANNKLDLDMGLDPDYNSTNNQKSNLKSRIKNTPYASLRITITNNNRVVEYGNTSDTHNSSNLSDISNPSSIKLRSGRIISKFKFL